MTRRMAYRVGHSDPLTMRERGRIILGSIIGAVTFFAIAAVIIIIGGQ